MPADLPKELEPLQKEMLELFERADKLHTRYRSRWDEWWARWRSYNEFKDAYSSSSARDRDSVMRDGQDTFGTMLWIPYTYATVETELPRIVAQRPRMLCLPRNQVAERNVKNMRSLVDAQQDRCEYELKLQRIFKYGLITGLGVSKVLWRQETRNQTGVRKASWYQRAVGNEWVQAPYVEKLWDDPDVLAISPWDWLWDPAAEDMDTMRYCFQRTWRNTEYVLTRLKSGAWPLMPGLDAETLRGSGSDSKYQELRSRQWRAGGLRSVDPNSDLHEVWEFHDGDRVVTMVDRKWPVQEAKNELPQGELPFQVYRPTEVPGHIPGIGEPESIADLQDEMNTLRTQRRDNARINLQMTWAMEEGTMDPDDFKIGAGRVLQTKNAPRDALMPLPAKDIPNSGYMEENALKADIERTTGISDIVAGGSASGGASETATGAQLLLAGATARIELKTRRGELETIKPHARWFGLLDQRRITENREVRIPYTPRPGEDPERRWAWLQLSPEELQGEFEWEPEGGSTAPTNVPQDRQDAQMLLGLMGTPIGQALDQREVAYMVLDKLGVRNPGQLLGPDQTVPPETLPILEQIMVEQYHVDPERAASLIGEALNAAHSMQGQAAGQPMQPSPNGQAPPEAAVGVGPDAANT